MQIDEMDRRLLRYLQADPGASTAELAEQSGLPQATCWRRLDKLRKSGVIESIAAVIDWRALGYAVEVSLRITLDKTDPRAFDDFLAAARDIRDVYEIQTFLGRVDVRLNVLARDMTHYQEIYRDKILTLPHITDIEALMHVAEIKRDRTLPL